MMSEMYYLKQEIAKLPSGKVITALLLLILMDRASTQQEKDQEEIENSMN